MLYLFFFAMSQIILFTVIWMTYALFGTALIQTRNLHEANTDKRGRMNMTERGNLEQEKDSDQSRQNVALLPERRATSVAWT